MKSKNLIILEEIFSGVSHGIAFFAVLVTAIFLYLNALHLNPIQSICLIIFVTFLALLYLFSTLYHCLIFTRAKTVFSILDKSAIYLFIAGTYTSLTALIINNWIGYFVLTLIWIVTILGTIYTALQKTNRILNTSIYLVMGWTSVIFIQPLFSQQKIISFEFILFGGLLYSFGVIFFLLKKIPFSHVVWHIFVIFGSLCHFFAIYTILGISDR